MDNPLVVTTAESTSQTQSTSVTVPSNAGSFGISVNTGTVAFSQSGTTLNLTGSGGNPSRVVKNTKPVTETAPLASRSTSQLPFPSTQAYSSGGYTGTLTPATGSPYVISGTGVSSKTTVITVGPQSSSVFPSTYTYSTDSNDYSGTLSQKSGSPYVASGSAPVSKTVSVTEDFASSSGTQVPDTYSYNDGTYSGTLTASGSPQSVVIDSKTVTVNMPNEPNSSPSRLKPTYNYNSNSYSGTLNAGTPFVYSGSAPVSKSITLPIGPQSSSSFATTYFYNDGTYSGTLTASGSPQQAVEANKTATVTQGPQSSSSFSSSYSYNDGTYSGTLNAGTPYASSGSAADSKTVSVTGYFGTQIPGTYNYNDGTYSGTLTTSGNPTVNSGQLNSKYVTVTKKYAPGEAFQNSINYNDGQYSGTISWVDHHGSTYTYYGQVYYDTRVWAQIYTGTVSKQDTRQWKCDYSGTVYEYEYFQAYTGTVSTRDTRQWECDYSGTVYEYGYAQTYTGAVNTADTRQWECDYTGTITKPDTRQWQCDYSGTVSAPGTDYYQYTFTISYVLDTTPPTISLSRSNTTVTATITDTESGVTTREWVVGRYTTTTDFKAASGVTVFTGSTINVTSGDWCTVYAIDHAGNEVVSSIYMHDDVTAPTIQPEALSWGKTVLVAFGVGDAQSGIDTSSEKWAFGTQNVAYFQTNGTSTDGLDAFTVSKNGDYTFYVKDLVGNAAVCTVNVDKVDNTAPTISLSAQDLAITATITDSESGVATQEWISGQYTTPADFNAVSGSNTFTGNSFTIPEDGSYTVFACDNAGNNIVKGFDIFSGNISVYTYDQNGNMIEINNSASGITTITYDSSGNILEQTNPDGSTVTYTYNNLGKLTSINDSVNGVTSFTYDSSGNLLKQTNSDGSTITYTYNSTGNLTSINDSTKGITSFTYDSNGNRTSETDPDGTVYTYNDTENITMETHADGRIVTYTYDSSGHIASVNDSNAGTCTYTYDSNDNILSVTQPDNTVFVYDDTNGKIGTEQYPNGINRTLTYNDGLLESVVGTNSYNLQYNYDDSSRIISLSESFGSINNNSAYSFDSVGNIQTVSSNGVTKITYTYDSNSQLIREDNAVQNNSITYLYDDSGNIITKSVYNFTTGYLGTATSVETNQYDSVTNKLINFNGNTVAYDDNGNLSSYNNATYNWNNGKLASVSIGNDSYKYQYNSNNIRTGKTVNGVNTIYTLNDSTITSETDGTNRLVFFYNSRNELVYMTLNNDVYYYEKNRQNDIIGIVDSNNNEVVKYAYDSWGKLLSISGTLANTVGIKNPFRYRSYYFDTETGLYYLQSRYYNPEWRRFISKDAIADSSTSNINLYQYCDNNPVMYTDPSGNATVYTIDTLNSYLRQLQAYALFYTKNNIHDANIKVIQYIRRLRYNDWKWALSADQIDYTFVESVSLNCKPIAKFFDNNINLSLRDPYTGNEIDIIHLFATMNIYYCPHSVLGFSKYNIDNLGGWAGDLESFVYTNIIRAIPSQNKNNRNFVYNLVRTYLGSEGTAFSTSDLLADVDAVNIYYNIGNSKVSDIFEDYYAKRKYRRRFNNFVSYIVYKGNKKSFDNLSAGYVNPKDSDGHIWPLYRLHPVSLTSAEIWGIADGFTDGIWYSVVREPN